MSVKLNSILISAMERRTSPAQIYWSRDLALAATGSKAVKQATLVRVCILQYALASCMLRGFGNCREVPFDVEYGSTVNDREIATGVQSSG